MMIPLLLAALALSSPLRAQSTTPEAALVALEPTAAHWADWRTRSDSMENSFTKIVTTFSGKSQPFLDCIASFDKDKDATVRRFNEWRGAKIGQFRAEAAAGTLAPDEAARRTGYVERLYRIRMLQVYGSIMPRSIDSCAVGDDGKPNGRLLTGPAWGIAASKEDLRLAEYALVLESGFSDEDAYAR